MRRALAVSLCLLGSTAAPAVPPGVPTSPLPAEPELVWVTLASADLRVLDEAGLPLGEPVRRGSRAVIYEVEPSLLPRLSELMHRRFRRCGGFFAHPSLEDAEAGLEAGAGAAGGPYTLDQQAWAGPLMSRVREPELRSTIEALAAYHNRYYQDETGVAAAQALRDRWAALAAPLQGASARLVAHAGWKQPSVVLTIPGASRPEELVVLGGHLDSINGWSGSGARAPGADDNASGIAVLTEAVRVLSEAGFRPARTVQFMGYAAEEVGLRGSQDLAKQYARDGRRVAGVIQFDMTNFRGSGDGIFLLTDNVDAQLTEFLGKLVDAYAGVRWATTRCGYACSDHASWTKNGFAASAAFEATMSEMNDALHTQRDTLATMGGTAAHSVPFARLAVAFAAELAKRDP